MQQTARDLRNERVIIRILEGSFPVFKSVDLKQAGRASLFDFQGFKGDQVILEVDVKVRDYASDRFKDLFVSTNKVNYVKENLEREYYVAFYFKGDYVLRVYYLNDMDMETYDLEFTHKRTKKEMKQKVFKIPADNHCFEANLV